MRKLIFLLFAFFMVGIVYAINAERPSGFRLENPAVIELFDSGLMVVSDIPISGMPDCISAENQNIGYLTMSNTREASGRISDDTYLKKSGTEFHYNSFYLYTNTIGAKDDNCKEVRIRGVDSSLHA